MAFTVSGITQSVFGNFRMKVFDVTPDASTGSFDTGMPNIVFSIPTIKISTSFVASGNTSYTMPHFNDNVGPVGTAIAGTIAMTGVVSGNVYRMVVFGPS